MPQRKKRCRHPGSKTRNKIRVSSDKTASVEKRRPDLSPLTICSQPRVSNKHINRFSFTPGEDERGLLSAEHVFFVVGTTGSPDPSSLIRVPCDRSLAFASKAAGQGRCESPHARPRHIPPPCSVEVGLPKSRLGRTSHVERMHSGHDAAGGRRPVPRRKAGRTARGWGQPGTDGHRQGTLLFSPDGVGRLP